MMDSHTEMRTITSPRMLHLLRMGEMTRHTATVNSIQGIVSETFPWDKAINGLSTMGLSTCTAIAGYYLKDMKLELFLAHVQPMIRPDELLKRLQLDGVEGITLDYINGTATKPERNSQLRQSVEQFFRERHINIHSIPANRVKTMKAPADEKIHSYGALLGMENVTSTETEPMLTVFEEI